MQQSRRDFAKKTAIVTATAAMVGSTAVMAAGEEVEASSNGVVVGTSKKKEIIYTKTKAWEEYYKQAK